MQMTQKIFDNIYKNRKVFVTGHTGFKGSWFVLRLLQMGAEVVGYSLAPPTSPSHYNILKPDIKNITGDIRDIRLLCKSIESCCPDMVFHFAAQPLVRQSYLNPVETFETNVIGTVNLLEACRKVESVKAVVIITSDKCYQNREWVWKYRETDAMGGNDPYSASKGCTELITASYRKSFFSPEKYQKEHQTLLATVRAGNAVGGGDWGADRLIPDIIRAVDNKTAVAIRNPFAIRPWQHILDILTGYLMLGAELFEGQSDFSGSWNFGPGDDDIRVIELIRELKRHWDIIDYRIILPENKMPESSLLKLDSSKARDKLGWRPVWNKNKMIAKTAQWYRAFYSSRQILSYEQLTEYLSEAKEKKDEIYQNKTVRGLCHRDGAGL